MLFVLFLDESFLENIEGEGSFLLEEIFKDKQGLFFELFLFNVMVIGILIYCGLVKYINCDRLIFLVVSCLEIFIVFVFLFLINVKVMYFFCICFEFFLNNVVGSLKFLLKVIFLIDGIIVFVVLE